MDTRDILRMAQTSLTTNKARSFLTMLGVIIGVGAVIAMLAVGSGARTVVETQIASLGTNVITIFPSSTARGMVMLGAGTSIRLKEDDAKAIVQECPSVLYATPVGRFSGQAVSSEGNWSTSVQAVYPDYFFIREWTLQSGDYFTDADVRNAAKVCVLGKTVADVLFGEGADPVGQTIRFRSLPLKVVGLLQAKGPNAMGHDQDDILVMPFTTLQRRILGQNWTAYITVSAVSKAAVPTAVDEITQLLRSRHRLKDSQEDDFNVRSQTEIADMASQTSKTLGRLLAVIASISLAVGGIGIINIMLVTVSERTREIGVRLSVGARRRDVLVQFLLEAVTLSCLGGAIGIGLGVVSSQMISVGAGWPVQISPASIVLAVVFAASVGIGFGFYPAWKAAHLDPIDALRYE